MSSAVWSGIVDPQALKGPARAEMARYADAAKAGRWDKVFELLEGAPGYVTANTWRPGGTSWYTPLHQVAWHGAPTEVALRLVQAGAWRTLRTSKGQRAVDIAVEKGHSHLLECLEPEVLRFVTPGVLGGLDEQLAALVESRIRPALKVKLRHPQIEVLTELPDAAIWYPIPGMYGGFSIELREHHLYVESWSRVVGGSGQAHVVGDKGAMLVNEGFV